MNGEKRIMNRAIKGLPRKPQDYIAYLVLKDDHIPRYGVYLIQNNLKGDNEVKEWTVSLKARSEEDLLSQAMMDILLRLPKGTSLQIVTAIKSLGSILYGKRKVRGCEDRWEKVDALLKERDLYLHISKESQHNIFSTHLAKLLEEKVS